MGFHFRFSYGGMKSSSSYLALPRYFNDHCPPVSSCCEVQKRISVKAHYYTYKFPSSTTGRASLNNMTYVM
ncbi:hypothetical protein ACOSQ3_004719 [Xanthoceras sorbifolium]